MLKGKFLEIRVDVTINKGNYESEKVGITYSPEDSEDIIAVIEQCKAIAYGQAKSGSIRETKVEVTGTPDKKPAAKKDTAKKPEETKVVAEETKAVAEEVTETEEVKTAEPKETKKRAATKVINYNRDDGQHKKKLADLLNKNYPNWKTDPKIKNNALSASNKFSEEPTPFIDAEGNIVPEFLEKLDKLLNA